MVIRRKAGPVGEGHTSDKAWCAHHIHGSLAVDIHGAISLVGYHNGRNLEEGRDCPLIIFPSFRIYS